MAELTDVATDDFFADNIRPLRNTYNLKRSERAYLGALEDRDMGEQLQIQSQLRKEFQQQRNAELAYQSGLFDLQLKQKKEREKINNQEQTAKVTKDLDFIVADPNKDAFQKQQEIARYGIQNAEIISKIPSASLIYRSAESSIKAQQAQRLEKERKQDAQSGTLFQVAQSGGLSPEEFSTFTSSDGIVTDKERILERYNQSRFQETQDRKEALRDKTKIEQGKAAESLIKADLDDKLDQLRSISSFIDAVAKGEPTKRERETPEQLKTRVDQYYRDNLNAPLSQVGIQGITNLGQARAEVMRRQAEARREASDRRSVRGEKTAGGGMVKKVDPIVSANQAKQEAEMGRLNAAGDQRILPQQTAAELSAIVRSAQREAIRAVGAEDTEAGRQILEALEASERAAVEDSKLREQGDAIRGVRILNDLD